jgi:SAM-dependent methyltransferase
VAENGYFKIGDPQVREFAGTVLPDDWWSRPYEYAWALQYAEFGQIVADMGCGWMGRPFKEALARKHQKVYAVDVDKRLMDLPMADNICFLVADFTNEILGIPPHSLDRIFCISVLEDLGDKLTDALKTFKELLKPDGLIVLTFDLRYDDSLPLGQYPALNLVKLYDAVIANDLMFREVPDFSKADAIHSDRFNLTAFHCVLVNT